MATPAGFALAPVGRRGEALQHADFEKLPLAERERIEGTIRSLQDRLQATMRQFPAWQRKRAERSAISIATSRPSRLPRPWGI